MSNKKQNDTNLENAFRFGDKKAFSKVYKNYYESLCRYTYSLTKDLKQAEDIVQETFINIWENHKKINEVGHLKSYLFKSAYYLFIDKYRANKRQLAMLDDLRLSIAIEVESERYIYDEKRVVILKQLIDELPEKRKEIFILNKIQHYRYKEIAEQLNISERTVESQIRKALITIREKVSKMPFYLVSLLFSLLTLLDITR